MPKRNKKGKFLVIEGSDGSGKKTQWGLLKKRLAKENIPYFSADFPIYQSFFGRFIKSYLHGEFGDPVKIDPYHASFAYALDRFFYKNKLEKALQNGRVVVANRYMESNKLHQGAKFTSRAQLNEYLAWLDNFEFSKLKVPRPNLVLYLYVPAEISRHLINKRSRKKKIDQHESNYLYQKKVTTVSRYLCRRYQHWYLVDCVKDGKLLSRQEIHEKIWDLVENKL